MDGFIFSYFILIYLFLFMAIEVQVRKGEPAERASAVSKAPRPRRCDSRCARQAFRKPSRAKRRKTKELDFNNMLRVRYSNM